MTHRAAWMPAQRDAPASWWAEEDDDENRRAEVVVTRLTRAWGWTPGSVPNMVLDVLVHEEGDAVVEDESGLRSRIEAAIHVVGLPEAWWYDAAPHGHEQTFLRTAAAVIDALREDDGRRRPAPASVPLRRARPDLVSKRIVVGRSRPREAFPGSRTAVPN